MKRKSHTEIAIENLVAASTEKGRNMRDIYLYREALRGLVRLAKSEQMLEVRLHVEKLAGSAMARRARRRLKQICAEKGNGAKACPNRQQQLEFY